LPFEFPNPARRLKSIHSRHEEIHQDQIRERLLHKIEGLSTINGFDDLKA
jgi:hypothetical protein